jgi:hypothetical protein
MLKSLSYVCKWSQVQVVGIQGANNQNRLVFKDGEQFGSYDLEKNLAIPAFFKQAYYFGHGMPIGIVCFQPYNVCRVKITKVMEDCGKLYLPSGQQFDEHKTQVYMTNEHLHNLKDPGDNLLVVDLGNLPMLPTSNPSKTQSVE